MSESDQKQKGISRIDSIRCHGWFVRVYRTDGTYAKLFSDSLYGGKESALQAAIQHQLAYIRSLPPEKIHPPRMPIRQTLSRNNKTGHVGISETFQRTRSGERIPCFNVSWCEPQNVPHNKRFYHHHYDSRDATLNEAVQFRKEKEASLLKRWKKRIKAKGQTVSMQTSEVV